MSERHQILETTVKARILDTHKHLEALQTAVAAFSNDFGLPEFERAWAGDVDERLTTYPIQAGYENVINGCMRIAQELCKLNGWSSANVEPNANEALNLLHENGIITAKSRTALKGAYERRNGIQHDYVGMAAREIHQATLAVIEHAPSLLQDVALNLNQRRWQSRAHE